MRNDDSFAAGYELGGKVGLVIYKVNDDGSLVGLWTIADQEGDGAEVLTPKGDRQDGSGSGEAAGRDHSAGQDRPRQGRDAWAMKGKSKA